MATSNNVFKIADLDFFSIRNNLKDYLRSQSTFQDYDFEGSGMSVLLDVLAYNTYYNSYYLNMIAAESFPTTAQKRENLTSLTKLLAYVPTSSRGAVAKVNVRVTPGSYEDPNINQITLDRWTNFSGAAVDGVNYPFVAIHSNTASKVGDSFLFSNVVIKQGEVITRQFLVDTTNTLRRFQIPSQNVDTSTLMVSVQESSTNTAIREYTLSTNFTEIKSDSEVYYLEEDRDTFYTIYFGDNVYGKRPSDGNIVIVSYLDTVGSTANSIVKFAMTDGDGVSGFKSNVRVTTVDASNAGTDRETIEQIRFRALNYSFSQNRCVTSRDYETLVTKDYPNVDSVSVWGGEENDPPVYGKVFLSLKTKGYYTLTNLEKENIKKNLIESRNVLSVTPEIVDPEYAFLMIRGTIKYNPTLTSKTSGDLLQTVKNAIYQYAQDELYTFKSTFKLSKMQYYIENSDASIQSSDINIYLQRRLPLQIGGKHTYIINFNTPLKKGESNFKLYTYPSIGIVDNSAVLRDVFFEEVPQSYTGIDSIIINNAGINYQPSTTVTITGDGTGATAKATVVNGRIVRVQITNPGINYTRAIVTVNDPDGIGSSAVLVARLKSNLGTLRAFYYKANGEKVFVNENAGTIDYASGKIVLSSLLPSSVPLNDFYDQNVVTVNIPPSQGVIEPLRNRIIAIDTNNSQTIQLQVIPVE